MDDLVELRALLAKEDPSASAALESLLAIERHDWVTIFRDKSSEEGGDLRMACFLREEGVRRALANPSFDVGPGDGHPGLVSHIDEAGNRKIEYQQVGDEDAVPLVFNRHFRGPFPKVVELAEDFRLFWDLYEDGEARKFLTIDEVGDVITVAEWRDGDLIVRKQYLRRYQAARQFALSLQIVVDRSGGDDLAHLMGVSSSVSDDQMTFAYHGDGDISPGDRPNFTRLLGKRIIPPPSIEIADVWPYEAECRYETFIIGTDENGDPITHSCDPDTLANGLGANPDSPNYLTAVFFRRNVFEKYYADTDRYNVGDGYLR
jgi:hypothetical protein